MTATVKRLECLVVYGATSRGDLLGERRFRFTNWNCETYFVMVFLLAQVGTFQQQKHDNFIK